MGLVLILSFSCVKEQEQPPQLITRYVLSITPTKANCGGQITDDGGSPVTARGVCWSTIQNPTIADSKTIDGTGTGIFNSSLTGLTATTTYFVKAYATNSVTTRYGNEMVFKTYSGSLADIEGNVYNTMIIGTQTWMAENLKTTKFNDNFVIPPIADNTAWASLTTPGYCWYNNEAHTYRATHGALYNWYTTNTDSNGGKNVCPDGWHVPSDAEWTTLTTFLGGESVAGAKMKEAGTVYWLSPNTGATNVSGFTGFPGGGRYYDGTFNKIGSIGGWWTSSELTVTSARGRYLYSDYSLIYSGSGNKKDGFSVRCLKNQ
jgi:uncharacterized protein (TIGR02145 family)